MKTGVEFKSSVIFLLNNPMRLIFRQSIYNTRIRAPVNPERSITTSTSFPPVSSMMLSTGSKFWGLISTSAPTSFAVESL